MTAVAMMSFYLAGTTLLGLMWLKKNNTAEEYLVARRNLGAILVAALIFGEVLSGASSVGKATEGFRMGLSAVWINWATALGCWLAIWLGVTKFFRVLGAKRGIMSVPEAYRFLFDRKTAIAMMLIIALVYSIIYSLQPLAAADVLAPIFGINRRTMAVIVGLVLTGVALAGGLRGMAMMNLVHSTVMFLALLIVAVAAVSHTGGWAKLSAGLPASYFSLLQPDLFTVAAWILGTAFSFLCAASVAGVVLAAKDERAANRGLFWGAALIIPYAMCPALVGMAAKVAYPHMAASTVLFHMANIISPWLGGLVSIAVIAAIFSTAPALLIIVATTITRDLYKGILRPYATDTEQLIFSRIVVAVLGIAGTFLGLRSASILYTALDAFQIRAFAGVVLAVALLWPRVNKEAAFWSLALGGGLAAVWHFAGNPFDIQPLWPSLAVGAVILLALTFLNKEIISEGYRKYALLLKEYNSEMHGLV